LIAFPFQLDPTGSVATVEQDSDAEIDQQIALAMLTRPGERMQVPSFGVADPAFAGFQAGALQLHCDDFGPEVEIINVKTSRPVDGREEVVINWVRHEDPLEGLDATDALDTATEVSVE
jgi:hypothetical protein